MQAICIFTVINIKIYQEDKMKRLNVTLTLMFILLISINTAFGVGWQQEYEAVIDDEVVSGAYWGGGNHTKPAPVDIDADGDFDMFIGELEGGIFHYRNDGTSDSPNWTFVEYMPAVVSGNSAPTFADIDGDGDYDMFIEGGGNITFYRNDGDATSPIWIFVTDNYEAIVGSVPTFVDIDADDDYDIFIGKGNAISFYRNDGDATSPVWTLVTDNYEAIVGSVPTFVDIDADDDYDMFVVNVEENHTISFYRNDGDATSPVWTFVTEHYDDIMSFGCCMKPAFVDIDGDDDYDVFTGAHWAISFYRNNGSPEEASWTIVTNIYFPIDLAGNAAPIFMDIDNDSDLDMFIGQVHGAVHYYRNDGASDAPRWTPSGQIVGLGGEGRNHPHAFPTFMDIDSDGDYDLFIGEVFDWGDPEASGGNINFYRNDGTPEDPVWTLVTENYANIDVGGWSIPTFADIDDDGDFDLFIGEYDGNINFYRNDSTPEAIVWVMVTENYAGIDVGEKSAPAFYDVDDDSDLDMFIGEGEGHIVFYRNDGDRISPVWTFVTANYNLIDVERYSMPTFADIDGDGDKDLFIGEADGGINLYRNLDDAPPPRVVGVFPEAYNQAAKNTRIIAVFSERMDETTLNESTIQVEASESGLVTGNIAYDDLTATVTFNPDVPFEYNEQVIVTLIAEIKDLSGSGLDGDGDGTSEGSPDDDFRWEFFIGAVPPPHALSLDGDEDYVKIGDYSSLIMEDALTVEAWIYSMGAGSGYDGGDEGGIIVNKEGEYEIARFGDGTIRFAIANSDPGWNWINSSYKSSLNTWLHIAWTYSAIDGILKLLVNGAPVFSIAGNGNIGDLDPSLNDTRIGGRQWSNTQFFDGLLDEVRIWNVARSKD